MKKLLLASALTRKENILVRGLDASGINVVTARTNAEVWQALMREPPSLLVLDSRVCDDQLDPWLLAGELGKLNHPRLVMLTAPGSSSDRLRAFEYGVRYCLTLPVSPAELTALFKTLEKEVGKGWDGPNKAADYEDQALRIDLANRYVRRKGRTVPLTGRECSLLRRLVMNAGNVSRSAELVHSTWGKGTWPAKRTLLKTYIFQLRRKIETDYRRPRYLISHRGLGYAFMPRVTGAG